MIPPVGMNFICVYGPATDLINLIPPTASAGKIFTTFNPSSIACSISEGLAQPGVTGIPLSTQYLTTLGLSPGLTMNLAPASTASSTCSVVSTVPAPTNMCGNSLAITLIASFAHAVLNVTSATGSPPSHNAFASGLASSILFTTTTGTIPYAPICSRILLIVVPPHKLFNN